MDFEDLPLATKLYLCQQLHQARVCALCVSQCTKCWKRNKSRVGRSQAASYLLLFHFDLRGHGDVSAADGKEEVFKVFSVESDTARVVGREA